MFYDDYLTTYKSVFFLKANLLVIHTHTHTPTTTKKTAYAWSLKFLTLPDC